jgi:hypothetical protein
MVLAVVGAGTAYAQPFVPLQSPGTYDGMSAIENPGLLEREFVADQVVNHGGGWHVERSELSAECRRRHGLDCLRQAWFKRLIVA